jgi:RNA polymerase sigma factor (sigma-70 family)
MRMCGRSTSTSRTSKAERESRLPVITAEVEDLLRRLAPQVLGAVVRRYGNFDLAEDATQEAMAAAAMQWPGDGLPENPRAWLITVASRRLTDLLRSEQTRRRREDTVARWTLTERGAPRPDEARAGDTDDTLVLLLLCCHPSLPATSQIALTLRAVGGLSTTEIARALLGSEQTMTRRITRAKQSIRDSGVPFALPAHGELGGRLGAVLRVLYLIFNEGYASTAGAALIRADLAQEAIRLARTLHAALPDDGEVAGLLALMLLIHARHRARTAPDGALIPMGEQDRSLWDRGAIDEGISLVTAALPRGPTGPYQLQAAIAAVHDEAESPEVTDWRQIAALYGVLLRLDDNPVVALNHAVAVSMVAGPRAGLELVHCLGADARINADRRFHAVRGHLLEMAGDRTAALEAYRAAARVATNLQQQRYLNPQVTRLQGPLGPADDITGKATSPGWR